MAVKDYLGALEAGFNASAGRRQKREAQQAKEERLKQREELLLKKSGYSRSSSGELNALPGSDADVKEQQNQMLLSQLEGMRKKATYEGTKSALADSMKTGNFSFLEQFRASSPETSELFAKQGIQQFGNVDLTNDAKLFKVYGIDTTKLSEEERNITRKKFMKMYDGKEWKVYPTDSFAAKTGFLTNANASQLEVYTEYSELGKGKSKAERDANVRLTDAKTNVQLEKVNTQKATTNKYSSDVGLGDRRLGATIGRDESKLEETNRHNKEQERIAELKVNKLKARGSSSNSSSGSSFKPGYDEFGKLTAGAADLKRSEKAMKGLVDKHFNGSLDEFYNTNLRLPRNAAKFAAARDTINKVRALARINITGADKKRLDELSKLTTLSSGASDLGATDVGWWDSTVAQAATYFSNDPKFLGNVSAKASYEAYKGILRVAMIGAAQTTTEMRNFTKMLGQQTQQHYTLLTQLDTSLEKMQAQYETFSATVGNRAVAKILTGGDITTLKRSRARIAKSLSKYNKDSDGKVKVKKSKPKRRVSKYFSPAEPVSTMEPSPNTSPTKPTKPLKRQGKETITEFLKRTGA